MDAIAQRIANERPRDKAQEAMDAFDQDQSIRAAEAKDAEADFDRAMTRQQIKDFKARTNKPPYVPGNGMNADEAWTAGNTIMAQKDKKQKTHHKKEKESNESEDEEEQEPQHKHKSHTQKKHHKK